MSARVVSGPARSPAHPGPPEYPAHCWPLARVVSGTRHPCVRLLILDTLPRAAPRGPERTREDPRGPERTRPACAHQHPPLPPPCSRSPFIPPPPALASPSGPAHLRRPARAPGPPEPQHLARPVSRTPAYLARPTGLPRVNQETHPLARPPPSPPPLSRAPSPGASPARLIHQPPLPLHLFTLPDAPSPRTSTRGEQYLPARVPAPALARSPVYPGVNHQPRRPSSFPATRPRARAR